MWLVLAAVATIALLFFWRGPNAVWGGLALGAVVGFVVALVLALRGHGLAWVIVAKGVVVGVLLGTLAEIVGRLSNRAKTGES